MEHTTLVLAQELPRLWPKERLERALALLPEAPRASALRFRRPADRQSRIAARLLLREGLRRLGCDTSLAAWRVGPAGKPCLAAHPAHFSFSHTPGFAAVALSLSGPLGLDVELPYALSLEHASRFLDAEEEDHVRRQPDAARELARLWTIKEAVLKADGSGLECEPREMNALRNPVVLRGRQWSITPVDLRPQHLCMLAQREEDATDMPRVLFFTSEDPLF